MTRNERTDWRKREDEEEKGRAVQWDGPRPSNKCTI